MVRSALVLLLLLGLVKTPYTFTFEGVEVRVPNLEVTRDHRYVLVHAFVRSLSGKPTRVNWQGLFTVVTCKGERLRPSPDCGVDSGTGQHITMGDFEVDRKPSQMLVYFNLAPDELPIQLEFADGSLTAPTSK